jgi:hypothetical protein
MIVKAAKQVYQRLQIGIQMSLISGLMARNSQAEAVKAGW